MDDIALQMVPRLPGHPRKLAAKAVDDIPVTQRRIDIVLCASFTLML